MTTTTTFDLLHDSAELRQALQSATWEAWTDTPDGTEEWLTYETELDGQTYYMIVYCDGSVEYTDDPASATGEQCDC